MRIFISQLWLLNDIAFLERFAIKARRKEKGAGESRARNNNDGDNNNNNIET